MKYKILSNNNRINVVLHVPTRGKILDSAGNIIADNRTVYTLTLTPFLISNINVLIKNIKNLIDISLEEINLFYSKLKGLEKSEVSIAFKEYLSELINPDIFIFFLILSKTLGEPLSGAYPKFLQPEL